MHQQGSNAIKADWFADDLRLYRDQYSLNLLSVHKHVINFQVDRWPHLLMIADPALERGPATVGLARRDFILLSGKVNEIGSRWFGPSTIELISNGKILSVHWREGSAVSFAPIRLTGFDLQLLKSTATAYRDMLAKYATPSASAVLLGFQGGDEYFRHEISGTFPHLIDSLIAAREQDFIVSCRKLTGMGRGFSPTGDDLIYSALIAFNYFSYKQDFAEKIPACLFEVADLTNVMGRHMLEIGLRGLAPEALQALIMSITANNPDHLILNRVLKIGSYTGYDLAAALLYYILRITC